MKRLLHGRSFFVLIALLVLLLLLVSLFTTTRELLVHDHVVRISSGEIENIITTFQESWQQPPTKEELKGLLEDLVRERILDREERALKLSDDELQKYFFEHKKKFERERKYSFQQVFLSPERRGKQLEEQVPAILKKLQKGELKDPASMSDPTLLPPDLKAEPESRVEAVLGKNFSNALRDMTRGEWTGPHSSNFGMHLVYLKKREEPFVPDFEIIKEEVQREYLLEKRPELQKLYESRLPAGYRVELEWQESMKGQIPPSIFDSP